MSSRRRARRARLVRAALAASALAGAGLAGLVISYPVAVGAAPRVPTTTSTGKLQSTTLTLSESVRTATTTLVTPTTSSIGSEPSSTLAESTESSLSTQATTIATATGVTLVPRRQGAGTDERSPGEPGEPDQTRVTVESGATLDSFALEPGRVPVTAAGRPILERLAAFPARFVTGPKSRERGTTLTFSVAAPGRLEFTVLGKAPECRRLGRFSRRVHRGSNRIHFSGRLRGRALSPGTYTIVPELVRGDHRTALASVTIVILSPAQRATVRTGIPVQPECRLAALKTTAGGTAGGVLGSGEDTDARVAGQSGEEESGRGVAGVSGTQSSADKHDPVADWPILSAILPDDPPGPPYVLGMLALGALVLCVVALTAFVVRFLRRSAAP